MRNIYVVGLITFCLLLGCGRRGAGQVTWVEQDLERQGAKVSLGYRLDSSGESKQVIPVAKLTNDESPMASAMVFATLLADDGTPLNDEVATRFASAEASETQLYLADGLSLDQTASRVRFRIVTANGESIHEIVVAKKGT